LFTNSKEQPHKDTSGRKSKFSMLKLALMN